MTRRTRDLIIVNKGPAGLNVGCKIPLTMSSHIETHYFIPRLLVVPVVWDSVFQYGEGAVLMRSERKRRGLLLERKEYLLQTLMQTRTKSRRSAPTTILKHISYPYKQLYWGLRNSEHTDRLEKTRNKLETTCKVSMLRQTDSLVCFNMVSLMEMRLSWRVAADCKSVPSGE